MNPFYRIREIPFVDIDLLRIYRICVLIYCRRKFRGIQFCSTGPMGCPVNVSCSLEGQDNKDKTNIYIYIYIDVIDVGIQTIAYNLDLFISHTLNIFQFENITFRGIVEAFKMQCNVTIQTTYYKAIKFENHIFYTFNSVNNQ